MKKIPPPPTTPNMIDYETALLLLKVTVNLFERNAVNFSKIETKMLLDVFERIEGDRQRPKLNEKKETLSFWISLLNSMSQIVPLRNYIMTREHTIRNVVKR